MVRRIVKLLKKLNHEIVVGLGKAGSLYWVSLLSLSRKKTSSTSNASRFVKIFCFLPSLLERSRKGMWWSAIVSC